jgi:hypothetical protein
MRLSQEAIDDLLHIIENFDRERGVPHNYFDLERTLQGVEVDVRDNELYILSPKKPGI